MPEMKASLTSGKGVYSYDKNPLSVPKKGSQLPARNMNNNSDRAEVVSLLKSQMADESLRGKGG